MEPQRDLAIILRSVAFEERHRIVTALTEQRGLVSALARNAVQSRRFGGALEIFSAADWIFTERPGGDLLSLREAQIRRAYEGLRVDFERLAMGGVFNELMLRLAPQGESTPELFKLHCNALAVLDEASGVGADLSLLTGYLAKLLQWSGSQPRLQGCLECGLPLDSMSEGLELSCVVANAGWVCENCRVSQTRHVARDGFDANSFRHAFIRVTPAAIRDFQTSLGTPIRQLASVVQASQNEHRGLFKFLEALVVFHLPGFDKRPLKSLRFLGLESIVPPQTESPPQNPNRLAQTSLR